MGYLLSYTLSVAMGVFLITIVAVVVIYTAYCMLVVYEDISAAWNDASYDTSNFPVLDMVEPDNEDDRREIMQIPGGQDVALKRGHVQNES